MKYAGWILSFILLVILLWQCPAEPVTDKVSELEKKLADSEERFRVADSIRQKENAERDLIIADLTAEKEMLSGELKVADSRISDLAQRVRHAKIIRDTVKYFVSCDSLVIAAEAQSVLIQKFEKSTDSLINTYKAQDAAKDSMIKARDQLYSEARQSFNKSQEENRSLQTSLEKEKNKRWAIGPHVGGGPSLVDKRVVIVPQAGLSVQYLLIKF